MSLKSIVAVASGADSDVQLIAAASALAVQHGAGVRVVAAFPDPAADLIYFGTAMHGGADAHLRELIRTTERESHERLEGLAREAAANAGLPFGVESKGAGLSLEPRGLQPALAVLGAATLADLVMFSDDVATTLGGVFAETLLSARAPILLAKSKDMSIAKVAIAWDGSVQSGRAARAAIAMLRAASEVVILRNVDDASEAGEPQLLKDYLVRQGVTNVSSRELRGSRVAQSLLDATQAEGCNLLVAGAYGRPRLYELVMGGTTRALVNARGLPHIFLKH